MPIREHRDRATAGEEPWTIDFAELRVRYGSDCAMRAPELVA
jgi:hypothetical protein